MPYILCISSVYSPFSDGVGLVTLEKDLGITFQDDLQTPGGQSQEGKLHARSYSLQFPIHRQQYAYTSL